MRVLIACEESQAVCKAFREKGHEAYSCDIQECSGGHPEWHIQGDVLQVLNPKTEIKPLITLYGNTSYKTNGIYFKTCDNIEHFVERWDLIIAHPPCTYLCLSGQKWCNVEVYGERAVQRIKDRDFAPGFVRAMEIAPDEVLEITLHKMIVNCTSLPFDFRQKSADWLIDRHYSLEL